MKGSARSVGSYSVLIISSPKQAPRTRTFSTTIKKRLLAYTRHPKVKDIKADNLSS